MSSASRHLSRRQFITIASDFTVACAAASILDACSAESTIQPRAIPDSLWSGLAGPYQVSISGPKSILTYGQAVTITGTVRDSVGRPVANAVIGVSDGIRRFSTTTKTDASGNLSYKTVVGVKGTAIVELVVNGARYAFSFQSRDSKSPYKATSALFSSIAIRNTTSRTLTARIRDPQGRMSQYSIPKNVTKTVVTVKQTAPKRVTAYAGITTSATVGELSATIDTNGVATVSVTGGQALLRGSIYATSAANIGVCWAPGAQAGAGPVEISGEIAVCLGTDGLSIGAGGSLGGASAGFTIDVI